jgi:predicted MPP superfamily phosphohydrolase
VLDAALLLFASLGHFALCVATFNRLHAIGIPRRLRRFFELLLLGGTLAALAWYATLWLVHGVSPFADWHSPGRFSHSSYANFCLVAAAAIVPCWLWPRLMFRRPAELIAETSEHLHVGRTLGSIPLAGQAQLMALVPGNQFLQLEVTRKTLAIAELPPALEGFTITHLSDLHFTGDIGLAYFEAVIREANELVSDVVLITGDIIESVACEPWLAATLGKLNARYGVYFVLGNHDRRMPSAAAVRQSLERLGLIDVGGKALVARWSDVPVLLAGNEEPWFAAVSDERLQALKSEQPALRLALTHSPDQYAWAREHGFQLMLAGHNHGGQVCLPLVGPIISPSRFGTRYAGGVFFEPPTLLHVTRGISGEHPIRMWCLPEVSQLTLVRPP